MGAKSKLTVPERRKVVLSLIRREEPAVVLARRFGIAEGTLYRWRDEYWFVYRRGTSHKTKEKFST